MEGDDLIPLAIIGVAFEFPQGATSEDNFWQMLYEGRSACTEFPSNRLNIDSFYHPDQNRPSTIPLRGGHFVTEDLGAFDAPFFSITPGEAACMDPQHRRMLQTAYHALDDAGITIEKCAGTNTSVYTGCFTNDYLSILQQDYEAEQRHAAMGIAPSMLANRISWFFDFKGTSMNLDSACSSSLLALHLACQDLRTGGSSMALVGGANLVYHPNFMKIMSDFNFLSRDSRSWSFDQRANGYARGEGIATVVLKRLDDALRDGNTIRAIIRNTGSNQDGKTPGITQPSQEAQVNLINSTYLSAGLSKKPTRFFEAHATGTPVGDPIEGNAIGAVFKKYRSADDPLYIGAVKANIGHLEGCSGLAGVIKTLLVLEKGIIPPISGFESLNDRINAQELHLHFPKSPMQWPSSGIRRACVNSFGFGGTNAVAILDDARSYLEARGLSGHHRTQQGQLPPNATAPTNGTSLMNGLETGYGTVDTVNSGDTICYSALRNRTDVDQGVQLKEPEVKNRSKMASDPGLSNGALENLAPKLLVWSAPDEEATKRQSESYLAYLKRDQLQWDDLAYTMAVRRNHFPWRSFTVGSAEISKTLDAAAPPPVRASPKEVQVAFVFTGQGAQHQQMGISLLQFSEFRKSLEICSEHLKALGCTWSVLEVLYGQDHHDINLPEYSQPLTTCLQVALVDLLRALRIFPSLVLGHSSGEISAAYASGALSKFSAIKVAYHRGRLSSRFTAATTESFTMMAVGLSRQDISRYSTHIFNLDNPSGVVIACVNSPQSVTLSGRMQEISTLQRLLEADGVFARILPVSVPYHTHFMDSISQDYVEALGRLDSEQTFASVPMISSVSGDIVNAVEVSSGEYWARNLTSPVQFEDAFSKLLAMAHRKPRKQLGKTQATDYSGITHVMEIGPHSALRGPIREIQIASKNQKSLGYMNTLIRGKDTSITFLQAVGDLYCSGYPVDLLQANNLGTGSRPIPPGMPQYPFSNQRYWIESSLSKNFRFRGAPRHDLLGSRSIDWNPYVAQWRNIIRLVELPWLVDHKISSNVVFPAAAMIVMIVEAIRQLITGSQPFQGVHIRDVAFLHAITMSQGVDKIETQLTVSQPHRNTNSKWCQFRLFVLEDGGYVECCKGSIRAVHDIKDHHRVIMAGPWASANTPLQWVNGILEASQGPEKDPYDVPPSCDIRYGPTFRNLHHMRLGRQGEISAQINTESWMLKGTQSPTSTFLVHPTTLDGLAQPLLQALLAQRPDLPTMVPTSVKSIYINCKEQDKMSRNIRVVAKCDFSGYRGGYANIVATTMEPENNPMIFMEGLETAFIGSDNASPQVRSNKPRRLCNKLSWKPDLEMMTGEQIVEHCTRGRPQRVGAVKSYRLLLVSIMCFVKDALDYVDQNPSRKFEWHIESYVNWMRYQQNQLHSGNSLITHELVQQHLGDTELRESLHQNVEKTGAEGIFFVQIGRQLCRMLRGEVDPLDFMFRGGLVDRYYEEMLGDAHHTYPASRYIDLLSFKNPSMNILEVGAGTGGQTKEILETMSSDGINKWARYDYSDISPSFFAHAKEKFGKFGNINYRLFDVSKDPVAQSLDLETYDLIIASHVLHATDKLEDSLRNIRKLLKPDGKLLLFETTYPSAIPIGFAFGLLKGWWNPLQHEPRSHLSPCLTIKQWDQVLKQTGFSGVDADIPGQEEQYCQYSSIMISTATTLSSGVHNTTEQTIYLVTNGALETQSPDLCAITIELQRVVGLQYEIQTISLGDLAEAAIDDCSLTIFLMEVDAIFLDGISEVNFRHLQSVLVGSRKSLWVTRADVSKKFEPRHHLADGLGRVLMSEDSARKFVTLSLSPLERSIPKISEIIYGIVRHIVFSPVDSTENNYMVVNSEVRVCRITEHADLDAKVATEILPRQIRECLIANETPLALRMCVPGRIDSFEWAENDNRDIAALGSNELLVEVRAIGLTNRDYLIATGKLNEASLCTEYAGYIIEAGPGSGFEVGNRVCTLSEGSTTHSIVRAKTGTTFEFPPDMSFAEAVSLVNSACLSYYALVSLAHIQQGETILIHEATSCAGQMAVRLAKSIGARALVTTSSPSKNEYLRKRLGIKEGDILQVNGNSFLRDVQRASQGSGVDVVFGALSGRDDYTEADFAACLAPFGRLIDISLETSQPVLVPNATSPNISRSSISLTALLRERPVSVARIFQEAMKLVFDQHLEPPQPLHRFPAYDVHKAFRHFEEPDAFGKRVIEISPGMKINASLVTKPRYSFSRDATYVIGGGLGGLGRSFARWMVHRGARNLVLLSRSGPQSEVAKNLVLELAQAGAYVATPAVNLSNLQEIKRTFHEVSKSMPPIRGCIQATVALRDNLFPNMTYDDWVVGTSAKSSSSWNLHEALPHGLDFFVLVASLNGVVGGRAQANYAAGNTFKDALAHYRVSVGEKAVAIDLGLMVTEGIVAENPELLASMRRMGHLMDINQPELLALLDYYCDPSLPLLPHDQSQVLVGLETPSAVRAKNIDLHHAIHRPLFRQLFRIDSTSSSSVQDQSTSIDYASNLNRASTSEEAADLVTGWFRSKVAQVLGLKDADVDPDKPVHTYGMDSLVAIDLKNWFAREIGADVQVFSLLGNKSLSSVAKEAAKLCWPKGVPAVVRRQ
ncbi:lovastatin nonaketide synthase [Xylaria grammica]|nr:lovastatin nonaketide synthase [Xylaria grammica]